LNYGFSAMRKNRLTFLFILFTVSLVLSRPVMSLPVNAPAPEVHLLDTSYLRNYAETRGFMLGRPVKAKPTPDGKAVLFLRAKERTPQQSLYQFDVGTGTVKELLTPEQVLKGSVEHLSPEEKARRERQRISVGGFTDFQISDDGAHILVSLSGKLYAVNRGDDQIIELDTGSTPVIDAKFAPDSKKVSYVSGYDLYVIDLATKKCQQVTTGGSDKLTHGLAEFVAQEEMARFTGYWWSPDSRFIAYEEADASQVEVWNLFDPGHPEQAQIPSFYPRPGQANVKVRLGVIPAAGGQTVWVGWDKNAFPYLATVTWSKNSPLTLMVQTRDQKEILLLSADPVSGQTTTLLTERDPAWVAIHAGMPDWLDDGSGFLWTTERNGAHELESYDRNGKLLATLVHADAGFMDVVDADPVSGQVTYLASTNPTQSQLFSISLHGGTAKALSESGGNRVAAFSLNHKIYVENAASSKSMPLATVHNADGTLLGTLPSVAANPPVDPNIQFVQTEGERKFYACLIRPQNFDPNKSYPVLVDVYGGPGHSKVIDSMGAWLLDQWLADQGFIIVALDNRGTPRRDREWERAIYLGFGSVPLDDQVAGLQSLAKRFSELDLNRVGITGWSFGGYMSALAVLRRPDVFKAAVAGAPVVDWLDYDTHYTERYLGLPETNPKAYTQSSLLTYADKLERPLLLVHGTTDDNVFFRHSLKLANALFRAGRDFQFLPLSGLTHMVPDPVVTQNLWSRIASFFHSALGAPKLKKTASLSK
jgi:dipeptidyl-peptidase 4